MICEDKRDGSAEPRQTEGPNAQFLKVRDGLVAILAFGAGSADAISFLTLGVFASFMSGNTITLGLGIGGWNVGLALRCVTAILGYVVGVAVGASAAYPTLGHHEIWPRDVTKILTLEFLILVTFAVLSNVVGRPTGIVAFVLILLVSVSMGMQGAGVHQLGVSGVATTYVTGTWTNFIFGLISLHRSPLERTAEKEQNTELQAVTLFFYVTGAVIGGISGVRIMLRAFIIPPIALGVVLVVAYMIIQPTNRDASP